MQAPIILYRAHVDGLSLDCSSADHPPEVYEALCGVTSHAYMWHPSPDLAALALEAYAEGWRKSPDCDPDLPPVLQIIAAPFAVEEVLHHYRMRWATHHCLAALPDPTVPIRFTLSEARALLESAQVGAEGAPESMSDAAESAIHALRSVIREVAHAREEGTL